MQSEIAQNILFLFQSSLTRMALHALSRMETRKFHSTSMECAINPEETSDTNDNASTTCQTEDIAAKCVICLEKFKDGQVSSLAFFLPLFYSFIHSFTHPSIHSVIHFVLAINVNFSSILSLFEPFIVLNRCPSVTMTYC